MCEFLSFFVSSRLDQVTCGNPSSHSNASVHSGLKDWREAEWEPGEDLVIRTTEGDDLSAYLSVIVVKYGDPKDTDTRTKLIQALSPSTDADGNQYWFNEQGIHRDGDKPAIIRADGDKCWYKNGKQHREGDEPAEIYANGDKFWYKNGELHRDGDEPAEIYADGDKFWYKNGELHRDGDEPAVVWADGSKFWYKNGLRHRDGDGPAVVWADGSKFWYKNGKFIREE